MSPAHRVLRYLSPLLAVLTLVCIGAYWTALVRGLDAQIDAEAQRIDRKSVV